VAAIGNTGTEIYWYLNPSGGAMTATGPALYRSTLSQTDTFYAEAGIASGQCAGSSREMAVATVTTTPVVALGNDTSICEGTSLTLDAGVDDATTIWNTGDIARQIQVNTAGTYIVSVTRGI